MVGRVCIENRPEVLTVISFSLPYGHFPIEQGWQESVLLVSLNKLWRGSKTVSSKTPAECSHSDFNTKINVKHTLNSCGSLTTKHLEKRIWRTNCTLHKLLFVERFDLLASFFILSPLLSDRALADVDSSTSGAKWLAAWPVQRSFYSTGPCLRPSQSASAVRVACVAPELNTGV